MPPFNVDGGIHEIPLPSCPGRLWLCGKHYIGPDPDAVLASVGASTVVCLVEEYELADRYPSYVSWLRANVSAAAVWYPIHDLYAPPLEQMRPFLDGLVARLSDGESLIVHCAAGIGRAGTTAVALLMLLGLPLPEARATVAAHRPMAGPEVGAQRILVEELAAALSS
jgi:protein-tyrosine phosphatase